MTKPFVSVLIDTYNHERFIEEAIVSVLGQDFPAAEREIIVIDDGSTDRTPEIVRKFEPHVRLLQKANGGQASAFNAGIPECGGEVVAFLDGDDWWVPQKLSHVIPVFAKDPRIGMVGHGTIMTFSGRQASLRKCFAKGTGSRSRLWMAGECSGGERIFWERVPRFAPAF